MARVASILMLLCSGAVLITGKPLIESNQRRNIAAPQHVIRSVGIRLAAAHTGTQHQPGAGHTFEKYPNNIPQQSAALHQSENASVSRTHEQGVGDQSNSVSHAAKKQDQQNSSESVNDSDVRRFPHPVATLLMSNAYPAGQWGT